MYLYLEFSEEINTKRSKTPTTFNIFRTNHDYDAFYQV